MNGSREKPPAWMSFLPGGQLSASGPQGTEGGLKVAVQFIFFIITTELTCNSDLCILK